MKISLERAKEITAPKDAMKSDELDVKYFKLSDGQSTKVRFIYHNLEEFEVFPTHRYERYKKVMCLRPPSGGSFKDCPVCEASGSDKELYQKNIVFVPIMVEETGDVLIWERSINYFMSELVPILSDPDVTTGKEIFSTVFKITRKGSGFNDTSYIVSNIKTDDGTIPEALQIPNASKFIAKRDYDELVRFVRSGVMPARGEDGYGLKPEDRVPAKSTQVASVTEGSKFLGVDDSEIPF